MVEKVNPSPNRPADAFTTAGAIGYGGGVGGSGYVVQSYSPTDLSKQDSNISESKLSAFSESHSATSYDVSIDAGEAFVFGSWVVIDDSPARTITLASDTPNQIVYLGWDRGSSNNVIIGLDSDFDNFSDNTDQRIPLYSFDTDTSGVSAVDDLRAIGKTITQSTSTDSNEVVQVPYDNGLTTSGVYQNDGELVVNGSFTSSGPIIGDGSISGDGTVAVSGVIDGTVEPITATINNNIFTAISGWTTDNDGSSYEAYRFERNGAIEIEKEEALTLERQ